MNPIESRKHLLLTESELNRAQLILDLSHWTDGVRDVTRKARTFAAIVSSAGLIATALRTFHDTRTSNPDQPLSRLQRLLKGAAVLASLYLALRPQESRQPNP